MMNFRTFGPFLFLVLLSPICRAVVADGPVAHWKFDEGQGEVAGDASGNGHDASLHDVAWVRQGSGFALDLTQGGKLDIGRNGALGIRGPVSIEAWIMPTDNSSREVVFLGESMGTYALSSYNKMICWYIGHGPASNWLGAIPKRGRWNHLVATFDGQRLALWINGKLAASRASQVASYEPAGAFSAGTPAGDNLPRFMGRLDNLRVYDFALPQGQILSHIRNEAAEYGITMRPDSGDREATNNFFKNHAKSIDLEQHDKRLRFANRQIGLEFDCFPTGFELNRLYGIAEGQDFLTKNELGEFADMFEIMMSIDPKHIGRDERGKTKGSLFGIVDEMSVHTFPIGASAAKEVAWELEETDAQATLHLTWKNIDVQEDKDSMDVTVSVTLRTGDPLSYWRIKIHNRSRRYGIERVRFPNLSLAPIGKSEDDVFVYPQNRGGLRRDPFGAPSGFGTHMNTNGTYYTNSFNMQFQALYDEPTGKGIFLGTRDPAASLMNIQIANSSTEIVWRPGHFPPNITFAEEDFELTYDCVAGPFRGDWYDACQIYRTWALQQPWCRKGPLRTRTDVPRWFPESPLYFYVHLNDSAEGTYSEEENMRIAADHFMEFLQWAGKPMGASWYAWKKFYPDRSTYNVPFNRYRLPSKGRWKGMQALNSHDGNYPKIPALDSLSAESKRLRDAGGMALPYLPLEIYDQGSTENAPYAAEAKPNITRDLFGVMRTWGRETSWQPCGSTAWWQNRLRETCVLMLQRENVGGFYLDVMQGSSLPCYWTPHGHSAAGGDSMTRGMHDLSEVIHTAVKDQDPEAIITGENPSEHMIDVIDGILTSTLTNHNKAPLFATVYQDYICRFGLHMAEHDPDTFFLQCASLFTEGAQIGMLRLRPRMNALSFQNPAHQERLEMLGRLVSYYRHNPTCQLLAYGQLVRPVTFSQPSPMPMSADGHFPLLFHGVFRDQAGSLGIFIVNAGRQKIDYAFDLDPARHGLAAAVAFDVDQVAPDGTATEIHRAKKSPLRLHDSLEPLGATMFHFRPKGSQ